MECGLTFFFESGRRHTRFDCDWSSDVCSSDLSTADVPERDRDLADRLNGVRMEGDVRLATSRREPPHRLHRPDLVVDPHEDRKSTRLNSSHSQISYAVFCLKKKKTMHKRQRHAVV